MMDQHPAQGLYDPRNEHDACGVGFIVNIKGRKSHDIIQRGLQILVNLDHRGAVGADPLVGDGAGCLIQMPDALLRAWAEQAGTVLPPEGRYAVGMCFMPRDAGARDFATRLLERIIATEGQRLVGWRVVPTDTTGLGARVIEAMPVIRQVIVAADPSLPDQDAFERKILVIRKQVLNNVVSLGERHGLPGLREFYMPSFSTRTIVYKGLLLAPQVGSFYRDLQDPLTTSALALVHQRFSTNTFPSWRLAHPYRYLAHNGEINTVRGNVNWMYARRYGMASDLIGPDLDKMWPLIPHGQSDTASIDNALELLVAGGYSLAHAMMLLIPEAWAGNTLMDPDRRAFYEYHAALMEPWDGPAAIAFTDGRQIGATLDRNGLRPARTVITDDDHVIMASESGVLPVPEERIVRKWRLQPGKMLLIDLEQGRIIDDAEIKRDLATAHPYAEWLKATQIKLEDLADPAEPPRRRACRRRACRRQRQRRHAVPPAGVRLHRRRHPVLPGADGAPGRGPGGLDGHRHAAGGAVAPAAAAVHLFQAELRPGHQPADRPDPRGAGDVAGVDDRAAAEPARPPCRHAFPPGSDAAHPDQCRSGEDPLDLQPGRRRLPHPHHRRHLAGRAGRGRAGAGARTRLPGRDRSGARRLQHSDPLRSRGVGGARADPGAAGHRRRAPSPDPPGPAHQHRAGGGNRRSARGAPFLRARRLRRRGGEPLPCLRHAGANAPAQPAGDEALRGAKELHQGGGQGHPEGDVQDGHLHLPVLLRRADLRGGRPVQRLRRAVLHRHRQHHRGRRPGRDRRGSGAAPSQRLWRQPGVSRPAGCGRLLRLPPARRGPCVDAGIGVPPAARRARQLGPRLCRLRRLHQRPERAAADHPRPDATAHRRPSRCRWTRSSPPPRSCAASPPGR